MTAPERRRPLPALAFIAALCVLTALVWFRVLHRTDGSSTQARSTPCPTPSTTAPPPRGVLPIPGAVSVLVLNSTQRNGIATATKQVLEERGFKVTKAADDVKAYGGHGLIKGVAEIRYGPAAARGATLLRYYFPGAVMKPNRSSSTVVTVSLGSKYTRPTASATVRRALAKAHLTLSAAPSPAPSGSQSC